MCAPGVPGCGTSAGNHFGGSIMGQLPASLGLSDSTLAGAASGLVGQPLSGGLPDGIIGNWNVNNSHYSVLLAYLLAQDRYTPSTNAFRPAYAPALTHG